MLTTETCFLSEINFIQEVYSAEAGIHKIICLKFWLLTKIVNKSPS